MRVAEHIRQWVTEADRLGSAGQLEPAIRLYQRVLAERPDLADSWYNLGFLQRQARQYDAALASYQQALERGVRGAEEVRLNRAVIFTDCLRDDAAAERELKQALLLNPAYVPGLQNLANLYTDLGRRDAAAATYERILQLDARAFEALARYAQLHDFRGPADPMIGRLEAALKDPHASAADRASLGFAMARGLDQQGKYRRAFAAAQAANQASRAAMSGAPAYNRHAQEAFIDQVISAFPQPPPALAAASQPGGGPQPVFICGMFRSGSTLAEQLLTGSPDVASAGEIDVLHYLVNTRLAPFPAALSRLPPETLSGVSREYLAQLARLFPAASLVTDKRLDNFYYLGLIRALWPTARIVHTTRDPLDVCLSIYFLHLDQSMSFALDLSDIGHYYRQYRRLMRHWKQLYGNAVFELNYDALVRDPEPVGQRLFEYCGLPWDKERLNFAARRSSIKTASVWQVREPLYQRASGRAGNYAPELARLRRELEQDA
jgi:tetratricopeptide (TPR) repeat protein